jgi:hypothetical protein
MLQMNLSHFQTIVFHSDESAFTTTDNLETGKQQPFWTCWVEDYINPHQVLI